ncbi:MAG: DNA polymerase III subunit gamma/tau, partial [Planctomycetota bacterium]
IDGASTNSVDDIRELRQNAGYAPAHSRFKIYIIDEVHMLSNSAFNALLKTLEEPPAHVKFVFATTEPQKVPETIRSRCQEYSFRNIRRDDIVRRLQYICQQESIDVEPGVLELIARRARGGMRDSQSLLDQLRSFSEGAISLDDARSVLGALPGETLGKLAGCFASGDVAGAMAVLDDATARGKSPEELVQAMQEFLRDVLVARHCGAESPLLFNTPEDLAEVLKLQFYNEDTIVYMLQVLSATLRELKQTTESRIPVEMVLVKLCWVQKLSPMEEMARRLLALEDQLRRGGGAAATPASGGATSRPDPTRPGDAGPAPAAEPLNLEQVQRRWSEFKRRLSHKRPRLGDVLAECRADSLSGGVLTVTFGEVGDLHARNLAREDTQKQVEGILQETFGDRLKLRLIRREADDDAPAGDTPEETIDDSAAPADDLPAGDDPDEPTETVDSRDAVQRVEQIHDYDMPLSRDQREQVLSEDGVKRALELFHGDVTDIRRRKG